MLSMRCPSVNYEILIITILLKNIRVAIQLGDVRIANNKLDKFLSYDHML